MDTHHGVLLMFIIFNVFIKHSRNSHFISSVSAWMHRTTFAQNFGQNDKTTSSFTINNNLLIQLNCLFGLRLKIMMSKSHTIRLKMLSDIWHLSRSSVFIIEQQIANYNFWLIEPSIRAQHITICSECCTFVAEIYENIAFLWLNDQTIKYSSFVNIVIFCQIRHILP